MMFSLSQTAANTHAATENQQLNTYLLKRISVLLFFADTNMAFHCVLLISDELEFSVIVQGRLTEKRTKEKQTNKKQNLYTVFSPINLPQQTVNCKFLSHQYNIAVSLIPTFTPILLRFNNYIKCLIQIESISRS